MKTTPGKQENSALSVVKNLRSIRQVPYIHDIHHSPAEHLDAISSIICYNQSMIASLRLPISLPAPALCQLVQARNNIHFPQQKSFAFVRPRNHTQPNPYTKLP